MLITRVYSGEDGKSHFEDLDITDHPDLDSLTKVTSIRFRIGEPGNFSDWHQESRRNYIITLSGERTGPGRRHLSAVWPRPGDVG